MDPPASHHGDSPSAAALSPRFSLQPSRLPLEDILFCVDVDLEGRCEMKAAPAPAACASATAAAGAGAARPPVKRMDAVKQALLLFVHTKLTMCPDHRFALASLGETVSLVKKEFSSDASSAIEVIQSLAASDTRYATADLTQLFKIAYQEGKRAELQGRLLRVRGTFSVEKCHATA